MPNQVNAMGLDDTIDAISIEQGCLCSKGALEMSQTFNQGGISAQLCHIVEEYVGCLVVDCPTQLTLIFILWYLYLSVVFHDKYQSYKYDQSYPHYMLMWASPQVHNNQLLYWTDSYFCDFAFVSCQLYFMKNIKVTNMQKYSREICPQGPQLPNLCWAKAEI